ncbi:large conductance mechanosensitive channel protein MscL [soil metagenome]
MKKIWAEYKDFINQGDIVTIAVGLVAALFFKDIIDAVVNGVILPIIAAIVGEQDFSTIGFDIGEARISIGLVLRAVLIFLIVGLVLYLIVKLYNRTIAKPGEEVAGDTELSLLAEIRDELRVRGGPDVPPPPGGPAI